MSGSRFTETVSDSGARPSGEIDLFAPGTRLGERWEIVRVLGRGGFSVVYLARDRELGRDVAVKVLRQDRLTDSSLRRFKREAAVARDLAHPHLVRIYDIEQAGGSIFLTLEAVAGGSLRERLADGPLAVDDALEIARQLFDGLAALHGAGIVHRDVKPGNVLLTESGDVKLADFGLALDLERDETRVTVTEATVGTLEYLSPEQALGEELDFRSDLYSAGIVLYEMLTGELPHGGRSSLGTLVARFRQRPPSVASLRPEIPAWLARLVDRLLERRRDDRYPRATAVVEDLERRRARLSAPRRRWLAAAGAAVALAVALAGTSAMRARDASRFSHIVLDDGGLTVTAVDRGGRALWSRSDVRGARNFVPFRFDQRGTVRLAALLKSVEDYELDAARQLSLLDPQTGEELDRLELAEAAHEFPDHSRQYSAMLSVLDLDGDGADELVTDFHHTPFWPSFSVLVEPRQRRSRVVLVASGHHWFKDAADLDGDGRKELLFVGINNRLGWHQGIAAVRAPEGLGVGNAQASFGLWTPAMSVDRLARSMASAQLHWYAVAPRGLISARGDAFSIDAERRELRLEYARRPPHLVDFDGFEVGGAAPPRLDRERRSEARRRVYFAMVEGMRLEEGGEANAAAAAYGEALRAADEAEVPILALWLRQSRNRARVPTAPWGELREEMEAIVRVSDHPAEVAFDTARALHRAGRLEEAVATYRRSFALRGASDGRGEYEVFEGVLLALVELGRIEEAEVQVDRYCRSSSTEYAFCRIFAAFVRWTRGHAVSLAELPESVHNWPDLQRYWFLELRLAAGEGVDALAARVGEERARASETAALLESLAAEIAGRSGRLEEAARRAATARDLLARDVGREPLLRVHAPLVRERAARWTTAPAG